MLDRTLPPPFVKPAPFKLPSPIRKTLSGGVELFFLNNISQDVVKIEVVCEAGKWHETKLGQAHFSTHMLEKGTKSWDAAQLAEFFERHGSSIEISSGTDFLSISLYTLSRHLKEVLPVFHQMLTQPSFDENEFELMKSIFIQTLRVNNEKTSYLASKGLKRNVFGEAHPYGTSIEESDLANLTRDDLIEFFQTHVKADKLFVVGKVTQANLEDALDPFQDSTVPQKKPPGYKPIYQGKLMEKVERASSIQSSIRFGKRTIDRNHKDFPGLQLLNHYFGGFFGSQLMQNLREEKGLTYGVGSSIHSFRNDALFSIGTDVNKENADQALEQIRLELRRVAQGDINPKDLELSRRHFVGSIQSDVANPFSVLSKIKNLQLHELSPTYYEDLLMTVDSISLDQLRSLGQEYFLENQFQIVTVG